MPGKVLIADDSLKIQRELSQLLKENGIEAVSVSNGEHAVRKLPTEKPDLVLADIFMPVRSGYEVCEYVKNHADFAHVAVLLLASTMEPFDDAEARRVGADGKVEKPLSNTESVLTTIQQHLQRVIGVPPGPEPEPEAPAAAAAPAAAPEPEPEPEEFTTRPPSVSFEEQGAPMGFADVEEGAAPEAPPAEPPPAEEPTAPEEATRLTSAEELRKRMEASEPPSPWEAPPPPEPAAPVEGFEPPPAAAPEEETRVEKPDLAPAWEMTGPEPGAPEVPPAGGWDTQWSSAEEEAGAAAEAPAEEAPPAPAEEEPARETPFAEQAPPAEESPLPANEFAAAFEEREPEPAAPAEEAFAEPPPTEPPAAPEREEAAPGPPPAEPAPVHEAQEISPAVVDQVVQQVLQRLSPQVIETIAREIVRPLAETLLKERLQK